ncbi:hypothetical protein PHET_12178 [Paragonimus heterotremus]|uniref:Uncharacterized protein n=1 Tax=Paragonimus heterotremus TaxID=100268 RepID=A0A8J4WT16_9TREM|nr:hypothetical protein PHET_12178 [Paragonimus heterotremus]
MCFSHIIASASLDICWPFYRSGVIYTSIPGLRCPPYASCWLRWFSPLCSTTCGCNRERQTQISTLLRVWFTLSVKFFSSRIG